MKTLRVIFAFAAVALTIASCKEDGVRARLRGDVSPNELTAPASAPYVLVSENKAAVMETFKWTATNYGFSASVTYTLQIDSTGKNFANAVDVLSTTSLEADVTVGNFNDLLLSLGYLPETAGSLDIRVKSRIGDNIEPVYSNTRTVTVTDYATSFSPIWGMGDGLKGWGPWPANDVEWQSSEYKKYSTIAYFTNDKAFRWFAQEDWNPASYNYDYFTGGVTASVFVNANDGDHNLKVVGATGWYQVDVDLNARTVVATAVAEPQLWVMGAGVNGWGPWPDNGVKMTYVKPGVFKGTINFAVADETWRFFAQPDWSPTGYNFTYFTSVDNHFINAADGDTNFRNVGTPGTLKIIVDLNAKTFILDTDPVLYATGAALNGWGWDPGEYISLTYEAPNSFSATATFTNGETFRFFAQTDWSPTAYNYPYYTGGVDADFENANDGDLNFRYIGTTGSRTVHVNMTTKTVTLD